MPTKKVKKQNIDLERLNLEKQKIAMESMKNNEFISKLAEMNNKLSQIEGNTKKEEENKGSFLRKLMYFLIIILIAYLALIIYGKRVETISTFPGIGVNVQDLVGHVETDLDFEEINIKDKSGNNINGLYVGNGEGKTVYYFHGNGGPLNYFYSEIKYINEKLGYNVMAYDYPGYGKSTGFPEKKLVDSFSENFYKSVKADKKINDQDVIIWGYSVGTAVATEFASTSIFDKLILVSPFSSRYDMSKKLFGFPIQQLLFINNSYNTKKSVSELTNKSLIIHGNQDKIVPFSQGQEVYFSYLGNKNFIEIDNFGHNGIIDIYGKSLKNIFKDFLNDKELDFRDNYLVLDSNKKQKLEKLLAFDLDTDSSIQKFVTSNRSFNDKSYVPENLVSISSEYVFDSKGGNQKLRKEANEALQKMAEEFSKSFEGKMVVVSAYRSYAYQKGIKDRGCPDNLCAKAGFSEHQSGLAIDFWDASTNEIWKSNPRLMNYFDWLNENAHNFGFHNTYQRGLEIDGYEIEPWHWRYIGVEFAKYLKENNLTIAEYYNKR